MASHWVAHRVPWVRDCASGASCVVSVGVASGCSYFVRVCFVCTGWGWVMTCTECGRVFDLFNETDAQEWYYGHDCESESVGGDS